MFILNSSLLWVKIYTMNSGYKDHSLWGFVAHCNKLWWNKIKIICNPLNLASFIAIKKKLYRLLRSKSRLSLIQCNKFNEHISLRDKLGWSLFTCLYNTLATERNNTVFWDVLPSKLELNGRKNIIHKI